MTEHYACTILVTDGRFSNSLALNWDVLALGLGGVAVAAPAQSASMITAQADLFSGPFGAYGAPLRFQLGRPSVNGGYVIVHVYYHHDIDAPKETLKAACLAPHVDSDIYIALHVGAGKTTPDAPSKLYDPANAAQTAIAVRNKWNVMTNGANQQ